MNYRHFLLLASLLAASPAAAAIDEALDATCRITAGDGGRGTGCVFEHSRGQVFVLTAAHVVGRDTAVQCEFWHAGHQSRPLRAAVIARSSQCDAALLTIDETHFDGMLPHVIPLAPRNSVLQPGATIASAGCAGGAWSTAWKGHVLGYQGGDLRFVPPPANGRSGSAVLDADGRTIVGLLRARTSDGEGIATSVAQLYEAFDRPPINVDSHGTGAGWLGHCERSEHAPVPSDPDGSHAPCVNVDCPGGLCPIAPLRPAPQTTPYPSLPRTPNPPSTSSSDVDGLRRDVLGLRAEIERVRGTPGPPGKDGRDGRDGAGLDPGLLRQWQDELVEARQHVAAVEQATHAMPSVDRVHEIAADVATATVADKLAPWATRSTTALLIGLGVPGGIAGLAAAALVWLGTRGVKRGLKRVETRLAGRPKEAAGENPFA